MRSLTTLGEPPTDAESSLSAPATADPDMAGAQDTIYLCNFRVSVDGEWLCLKELQDVDMQESYSQTDQITSPDDQTSPILDRDPVVIERSNLVNISKLVIKELIDQSLRYGRMLDTDHLPLRHFFIVLEHVLRHGLKPKKGLLGPKKELWDILQMVEKFAPEAQDITASVRDLPTVRTAMGRARAWLRLALMQKKLADYLRVLLEHRDQALAEYFEPHALVLSDEAVVIMGLLLGLNVIDCNLCVKEEDLDSQQGVIDFSLYLRGSGNDNESPSAQQPQPGPHRKQIAAVLDQKNYIEELNRHLNATVANLQAKVEGLTTTNALMKEDLAISKNGMIQLYEENNQLKHALGQDLHPRDNRLRITEIHSNDEEEKVSNKSYNSEKEKDVKESDSELAKALDEEKSKRRELKKELELQMSLKAEMEVAMKLLEKDIHDKQDTIISLRRQLDDIKLINLEMYKKLQVCESSLKHKAEVIVKLEEKTESMGKTIEQLDEQFGEENSRLRKSMDKLKIEKEGRIKGEEGIRILGSRAADAEKGEAAAEGDLRIEREWRISLQETMMKDRERISELMQDIETLKSVEARNTILEDELESLHVKFAEAQTALEEVGDALSSDKLKVAELMEAVEGNHSKDESQGKNNRPPGWANDSQVVNCRGCEKDFNLTRRKHHCRKCGDIFCGACSDTFVALEGHNRPVRVCDKCKIILLSS